MLNLMSLALQMKQILKQKRLASEREQKTATQRLFSYVSLSAGYGCAIHITKAVRCWGLRHDNVADKIQYRSPNEVHLRTCVQYRLLYPTQCACHRLRTRKPAASASVAATS